MERKIMQDELEKESEGKIYIIGIKEEKDQEIREVKIGFTKVSAQSRKGQMQTCISKKLDIIYESIRFPYASVYEKKYLFPRLANRNIAREWFKLSDDEIVDLINEIEEDSEVCFDIGKTYSDTGEKLINGTFNSIYLEKSEELLFPEDEPYTVVENLMSDNK